MSDESHLTNIDLEAPASPLQALQSFRSEIPFVRSDSVELVCRDTDYGRIEIRALLDGAGHALLERRYASRGYRLSRSADVTLGAYWEGRLVATLGLRRDGGSLAADQSFPDQMTDMRQQGWQLCEFTRLAADPDGPSKLVLASLFHLAYLHAVHHWGAEFVVIEVNPRHKAFYRRMLDFQPHGEERLHRGVGAPAVLMSLSLAYVATQVRKHGGSLNEDGRSRTLFPYSFPPEEETDLLAKLADVYGYDA
ncbi:long-chain N-acyl amino acid synthase [Mitsuaria sp. GD03876]|uniref:N-acyl amino acid synthase FeeM domain-containing protein n=1 Tax=Mitsuaria sp. GD03876 TaxID=2975399 RepID=UPI00244A398A|nr:long-chain N-acyl amino acid synthase [Mitsuaria sp. GD03876]MDH0866726.1 long-chain N-acyl amino acid synthase [Mitsuaria sp. GD03876]